MRFFRRILQSNQGVSLAEALMGMAAVGGILSLMLSMNTMQQKMIKSNRTISSRDSVRSLIDRYAGDPSVVARSAKYRVTNAAGNIALNYCISGSAIDVPCTDPAGCCRATQPDEAGQPFHLVDPSDRQNTTIISGTVAAVAPFQVTAERFARFDGEGTLCPEGADVNKCPIEVVTSFVAECGNGLPVCEKASAIRVLYSVRQAEGTSKQHGSLKAFKSPEIPLSLSAVQGAFLNTGLFGGGPAPSPSASAAAPRNPNMRRHIYTADDAFEVPEGVHNVFVTLVGGGGGGGHGANCWHFHSDGSSGDPGAGGASSCARIKNMLAVTPGEKFAVKVGKGGAPGTSLKTYNYTCSNGTSSNVCTYQLGESGAKGGTSSFGSLLSIDGGDGGPGGFNGTSKYSLGSPMPNLGSRKIVPVGTCPPVTWDMYFGPNSFIMTAQMINGNPGGVPSAGSSVLASYSSDITFGAGGSGGNGVNDNWYGCRGAPGPGVAGKDGVVIVEY